MTTTSIKEFVDWEMLEVPGRAYGPVLRVWRFSSYKALVEYGSIISSQDTYYRSFYLDLLAWGFSPFTKEEAIRRDLGKYLDGTIKPDWERDPPKQSQQTCTCTLQTVMNIGCQCGGN